MGVNGACALFFVLRALFFVLCSALFQFALLQTIKAPGTKHKDQSTKHKCSTTFLVESGENSPQAYGA
jgi:hypothetical protein